MNEQTRYRVTGAIFLLAIAIIVLPMVFDGKGVRVRQLPELAAPLPPAPGDAELDALKIPAATRELHREEMAAASGLIDKDGFDTADNTKLGDPALLDVTTLAETETMATSAASEAAEKTVETATATLPASAASMKSRHQTEPWCRTNPCAQRRHWA